MSVISKLNPELTQMTVKSILVLFSVSAIINLKRQIQLESVLSTVLQPETL